MKSGLPVREILVFSGEPGAIGDEEEPDKVDHEGVDNEQDNYAVLVLKILKILGLL